MIGTLRRRLGRASLLLVVGTALALPTQASAGSQVPLKGSDSGSFTLTADGCGAGVFAVVVDDVGHATHLGMYAYQSNECFDPTTGAFSGTFTMTAANGDTISGTYAGVVASVVGDLGFYEQDNVITSGTGRFAGASGGFHLSGIANLATLASSQRLAGTVEPWIRRIGQAAGDSHRDTPSRATTNVVARDSSG
jgi:hypothetical protein